MEINTKLILDKRREKQTGKYPVLLRITFQRKCIYKPTKKEFTEKEWEDMWKVKPPENLKTARAELVTFESVAETVIGRIPLSRFSLAEFNQQYENKDQVTGISGSLESHFKKYQASLWSREQVKTSYMYKNALNSIETFRPGMMLSDITADLLEDYKFQMKKDGKSLTTVSMYMRALRTIINKAIDSGDFSSERKYYPFGKNKFKIPAPLQKKKTLTIEQLTKLVNYKPKTEEKAFARDMFLFSYYTGGPNPVDIAKFKYEWIKDNYIHFPTRSKNADKNQEPIPPVPIDSELKKIIDKWKVGKPLPKSYVFGILDNTLDAQQIVERVNGFNKTINAGLKAIATDDIKIKCVPTMGYARATQANNLLAAGVSVEEIGKHMGHASPKTTKIYLKQLPDNLYTDTLSKLRLPKLKAV